MNVIFNWLLELDILKCSFQLKPFYHSIMLLKSVIIISNTLLIGFT